MWEGGSSVKDFITRGKRGGGILDWGFVGDIKLSSRGIRMKFSSVNMDRFHYAALILLIGVSVGGEVWRMLKELLVNKMGWGGIIIFFIFMVVPLNSSGMPDGKGAIRRRTKCSNNRRWLNIPRLNRQFNRWHSGEVRENSVLTES